MRHDKNRCFLIINSIIYSLEFSINSNFFEPNKVEEKRNIEEFSQKSNLNSWVDNSLGGGGGEKGKKKVNPKAEYFDDCSLRNCFGLVISKFTGKSVCTYKNDSKLSKWTFNKAILCHIPGPGEEGIPAI